MAPGDCESGRPGATGDSARGAARTGAGAAARFAGPEACEHHESNVGGARVRSRALEAFAGSFWAPVGWHA
eukprot:710969-Alexandrium_andersonii.AAC.1